MRLANIMKEIHLLPPNLVRQPSIQLVDSWYRRSFEELVGFSELPAKDPSVLSRFVGMKKKLRD